MCVEAGHAEACLRVGWGGVELVVLTQQGAVVPVAIADLQVVGLAAVAAVNVQLADIEHDPLTVGGRDPPLARVT